MSNLSVTIGANIQPLLQGMKKAQESIKNTANRMKSIGNSMKSALATGAKAGMAALTVAAAAAGVAITGLFAAMDYAGGIQDTMDKFDLTTSEVQKLTIAARIGSTDIDTLSKSMGKLALAVNDPSKIEDTESALKQLGITNTQAFKSLNQVDQIMSVAEAYSNLKDKQAGNVALNKLFGKSYQDIIIFLKQGKGIMSEIKNIEFVDQKKIALLDQFGEAWEKLKYQALQALTVIAGGGLEMNGGLIGQVAGFGDKLMEYAYKFVELIKSGQAWTFLQEVLLFGAKTLGNYIYSAFIGVFDTLRVTWSYLSDTLSLALKIAGESITLAILKAIDSIPGINTAGEQASSIVQIGALNNMKSKIVSPDAIGTFNQSYRSALDSDKFKAGESAAHLSDISDSVSKSYEESKKARIAQEEATRLARESNKAATKETATTKPSSAYYPYSTFQ